jgi:NAD(P)-dependent dehydrogenase (short-subunit alcohol dehydrogenase family)
MAALGRDSGGVADHPQGSGHIIQISSIHELNAIPTISASKWGLEGFSQSLAAEVADFGIKVTIAEPGGYKSFPSHQPRVESGLATRRIPVRRA